MPEQYPVFQVVNGELVRKAGDVRDPNRRYALVADARGTYHREFTSEEERQRDAEEAQWAADAPQREAERKRQEEEAARFRASLKYEERVVAFIDVLGWSHLVKQSKTDGGLAQKLGLALEVFRQRAGLATWMADQANKNGLGAEWPGDPRMLQFSDCVALSTRGKHAESALLHMLSFVQVLFAWGFPVRGGVSVGQMYHSGSMVYGPALTEAYRLESQVAIHPRIVLDDRLAAEWGPGSTVFANGVQTRVSAWRRDADGIFFYDFLHPFPGSPDSHTDLLRHTLPSAGQMIEQRIREFRDNPSVLAKYRWLADYFNAVCKENPQSEVPPVKY